MRRSRAQLAGALAVVLAGAGVLVATRTTETVAIGSLRAEPVSVAFGADVDRARIRLLNAGATAETFAAEADRWLSATPAAGVVPPGSSIAIVLRVVRLGLPAGTTRGALRIQTAAASGAVRVTVDVPAGADVLPGGARLEVTPSIDLGTAADGADAVIVNRGAEELRWTARASDRWISVLPERGTVPAGSSAKARVGVDRTVPEPGARAGSIAFSSNGGDARVEVRLQVVAAPALRILVPTLDFGLATGGTKTLSFALRNAGRARLTYQVSVDKDYVSLPGGGVGVLDPGRRGAVRVTYDYEKTFDGPRRVTLVVSSNGGSGVVVVTGVTDSTGPYAQERRMPGKHEHCSGDACETYRHAFASVTDESSEIVEVLLEWRVCSGVPGGQVTCDDPRSVAMRRTTGSTFKAEVGPMPACTPGVGSYIPWQIYTKDALGNRAVHPGSSTTEITRHCRSSTG